MGEEKENTALLVDLQIRANQSEGDIEKVFIFAEYGRRVSKDILKELFELGYNNSKCEIVYVAKTDTLRDLALNLEDSLPILRNIEYALVFDNSFFRLPFGKAFAVLCQLIGERIWVPKEIVL